MTSTDEKSLEQKLEPEKKLSAFETYVFDLRSKIELARAKVATLTEEHDRARLRQEKALAEHQRQFAEYDRDARTLWRLKSELHDYDGTGNPLEYCKTRGIIERAAERARIKETTLEDELPGDVLTSYQKYNAYQKRKEELEKKIALLNASLQQRGCGYDESMEKLDRQSRTLQEVLDMKRAAERPLHDLSCLLDRAELEHGMRDRYIAYAAQYVIVPGGYSDMVAKRFVDDDLFRQCNLHHHKRLCKRLGFKPDEHDDVHERWSDLVVFNLDHKYPIGYDPSDDEE